MLGHRFHNQDLLKRALTHRSILPETGGQYNRSNEQLEFLGDAVLDLIVVEYLCKRFPNKREGELSKLKAMVVSGQCLQDIAHKLNLGNFILMSDNEARNGGRERGSILEDTFEALIAALYLDGGYRTARRFIKRYILPSIDHLAKDHADYNYKSQLLEYVQSHGLSAPYYRVIAEDGPDHAKHFHIQVTVNGKLIGRGCGLSKKAAQQEAAYIALEALNK